MLSVENAETYRHRYLEHSSLIFEPTDQVYLEAIRLVSINDDWCVESFEIQSSNELLKYLEVSPMRILWHSLFRN